MIKLTHLDGRKFYIHKGAITQVEVPAQGAGWAPHVKTLINGSIAIQESIEEVLELIK